MTNFLKILETLVYLGLLIPNVVLFLFQYRSAHDGPVHCYHNPRRHVLIKASQMHTIHMYRVLEEILISCLYLYISFSPSVVIFYDSCFRYPTSGVYLISGGLSD